MTTEFSPRLDFVSLPEVVSEKIASFLHGRDLINLAYTCKYWYRIAEINHVWKNLVFKRFGNEEIGTGSENESDVNYKQLYMKLASAKIPAKDFNGLHRPDEYRERYFRTVEDPDSKYGKVIKLIKVCWLQINASYKSVIPGGYKLIWRMRLDDPYVGCNRVEFCARPQEFHGTELCKIWKDRDFKEAVRCFGSGKWFEADFGEFEVTSMCNVCVEVKGKIDWWSGGISWDYVELRPIHSETPKSSIRDNPNNRKQGETLKSKSKKEKDCLIS